MSTPEAKKRIPGPVIAIVLIALVWLSMQIAPLFSNKDTDIEPIPQDLQEPEVVHVTDTQKKPEMVLDEAPYVPEGNTWSTYHGGSALTGVVDVAVPDTLEVMWRYQAESGVLSPPVTDDTHLYFSTLKGQVISLDYQGEERWTKKLLQAPYKDGRERPEHFEAPIAIFNNRLFVGAMSGILYTFMADDGEATWTYDIGGPILGTVNFFTEDSGNAQAFLIDQGEGSLHSLTLDTGELKWKSEPVDRCDGSPSILGGKIVYGSCAAALHVFDARDGSLKKNIEYDVDSQVAGGVAIVGHSAYSGSYSGRVFRSDLRTGEVIWTNEDSEDEVFTTPAVNADRVIVSSLDGLIYALNKTDGKQVWNFDTQGVPQSPIIAQDKVVVTSDGVLYVFSLESGEVLWSYEVSDEISAPAIIGGMIVVGSEDGTVTAFGTPHDE